MNAVATKPQRGKAKPKAAQTAPQARLKKIFSALTLGIAKLESCKLSLDGTDAGEPAHVLLITVIDEMIPAAIAPLKRSPLSLEDTEAAYTGMFPALAAIEGVIALSLDHVVETTLREAHAVLDAANNDMDFGDIRAALPSSVNRAEFDFIRGRNIAINMINEGSALAGERDCYRRHRDPRTAQDNFVNGYLSDIIEEPVLRVGFCSVLSQVIGSGEGFDGKYFEHLTLAETQSGQIGADGTVADEEVAAAEAPRRVVGDETSHDPYIAACQAMRVLEAAALDAGSDALWGLRSLLEKTIGRIELANGQRQAGAYCEESHELASNEMAGFLSVLRAVDSASDGSQSELLGAAETLVMVAKKQIDDEMHDEITKEVHK